MKTLIFYLCMYKDTASCKEISLIVNDTTDKTNTKQKKIVTAQHGLLLQILQC